MNMGGDILIMPLNEDNLKEEDTERRTTNLGQTTFLPSERPQAESHEDERAILDMRDQSEQVRPTAP